MKPFRTTLAAVVAAGLLALAGSPCQAAEQAAAAPAAPSIDARADALLAASALTYTTAAQVDERCTAVLALATDAKSALEARKGPATMEGDYAAYDTLTLVLSDGAGELYTATQSSPIEAVRKAAEACIPKLSELSDEISLSRPIYDRLAAIPTAGLDAKNAYTLRKQLTDYRLAGVDKDAATREKVRKLNAEITRTGLQFQGNIRDDKGDIALEPGDLAGLPADYVAAHGPGKDGLIHLSYDYPDVFPVLQFADQREVRKKVYTAFWNRGHPANDPVLKKLLEERYELAQVLGYPDYAHLVTVNKMIGSPEHAATFLDEVNAAAQPGSVAENAELLAFAKTVDPSIRHLQGYDLGYMQNKLRKARYDVDQAQVRQYFTLARTRAGIFRLVHTLFGSDIRPWHTPVWDPDVTAWELYDGDRLVGRFYLDLSPRDGKYNHAAQFQIRTGVEGRQVPVGALLTNFPASGPMSHGDVTTFLHEFGHLLHDMYSGHTQWATQSYGNLQWDFIEAPSQMLEEWTWDYDTLKTFASNDKGEPIPEDLVKRMNAARHFGEPTFWKRQLGLAAVSLNYYDRKPDFDLGKMFDQQFDRYSPFPVVPGTHMYAGFGHLFGYSAIYYTYVWSKAIALDLFTRFKAAGMDNRQLATRYRQLVLDPGGSEDANELIQNFLGRPLSLEAFKQELLQN